MLLKRSELDAIKTGRVSLVFRRWRRPSVKAAGTLKTAVGLLAIDAVDKLLRREVTHRDATAAGHASLDELLQLLDQREGDIYRITLHFAGADPRIALREDDALSAAEMDDVLMRLARLDKASKVGPWTARVLRTISAHPHLAAVDLAAKLDFDKPWLKLNIRKLKNMGLTISHHPGYEISPRGKAVLVKLGRTAD